MRTFKHEANIGRYRFQTLKSRSNVEIKKPDLIVCGEIKFYYIKKEVFISYTYFFKLCQIVSSELLT